MKKIFLIFIALVFYSTSVIAVEKMKFKYNFHENLPKKWITEFENIMNIVQEEFPIDENTNNIVKLAISRNKPFNIYAWLDTSKDPFPEFKKHGRKFIMNESAIMGDGNKNWMQLKVHKQDIRENISMSYYVVVHEYFHIYQQALSKLLRKSLSDYNAKWLVEGGATVLGNIYTRQYYGKDTLKNDIQDRKRWKFKKATKEPHLYEKHETSPHKGYDSNYAGSSFILLAFVNELQKKNNISEEEAFELVFREYWIQRSKQAFDNNYWRVAFKKTFGMTVPEFYERLSKYKRKDLKKILPSKTLKIQDIFS